MRNFRELNVWIESMAIVKETYKIASMLLDHEKFGFRSQISRAAVSIPSNIAEGSAKSSNKEVKRYFEIAMGSSFELETQLILIKDLKLIEEFEGIDILLLKIHQFQKMLNKFISSLKNHSNTKAQKTNTQHPTPKT